MRALARPPRSDEPSKPWHELVTRAWFAVAQTTEALLRLQSSKVGDDPSLASALRDGMALVAPDTFKINNSRFKQHAAGYDLAVEAAAKACRRYPEAKALRAAVVRLAQSCALTPWADSDRTTWISFQDSFVRDSAAGEQPGRRRRKDIRPRLPAASARSTWSFDIESIRAARSPQAERYAGFYLNSGGSFYADANFTSELWRKVAEIPSAETLLLQSVSRGILIDLGSNSLNGLGFAERLGARQYVAVELYPLEGNVGRENWTRPPVPAPTVREFRHESEVSLDVFAVEAEMLDLVSRLPMGCASFIVNGIDRCVAKSDAFHEALADELVRATPPGAVVFGIHSAVLELLANRPGFAPLAGLPEHMFILRRVDAPSR